MSQAHLRDYWPGSRPFNHPTESGAASQLSQDLNARYIQINRVGMCLLSPSLLADVVHPHRPFPFDVADAVAAVTAKHSSKCMAVFHTTTEVD